jgi:hypothetical protein
VPQPLVESYERTCNVDAGNWSVDLEATSWTGGAVSYWSQDLLYVEQHAVLVVSSPPEPVGETLSLTLSIVSDWRTQLNGVSTVFTCGDEPTTLIVLLDTGGEVADCLLDGDPALLEVFDVDCELAEE